MREDVLTVPPCLHIPEDLPLRAALLLVMHRDIRRQGCQLFAQHLRRRQERPPTVALGKLL